MLDFMADPAEVTNRTANLVPRLRASAATTDYEAAYPEAAMRWLHEAGLCVAPLPKRWGGLGLNDSCAATEGCTRNLIDSDNLHLCSVTPVGASSVGATCTISDTCRTGE